MSGVLRMLTAAVRKAEKGGKWEKLQRGHFEECSRGKKNRECVDVYSERKTMKEQPDGVLLE